MWEYKYFKKSHQKNSYFILIHNRNIIKFYKLLFIFKTSKNFFSISTKYDFFSLLLIHWCKNGMLFLKSIFYPVKTNLGFGFDRPENYILHLNDVWFLLKYFKIILFVYIHLLNKKLSIIIVYSLNYAKPNISLIF